jgi:hypothetical protein
VGIVANYALQEVSIPFFELNLVDVPVDFSEIQIFHDLCLIMTRPPELSLVDWHLYFSVDCATLKIKGHLRVVFTLQEAGVLHHDHI